MLAFFIWSLIGILFIVLGVYCFRSNQKIAFGFWANAKMFPVKDVKAYNKSLGKLWCAFGIVFVLLGIPLLSGQNSPLIIVSILGLSLESIVAMAVYTTVIEPKHRL